MNQENIQEEEYSHISNTEIQNQSDSSENEKQQDNFFLNQLQESQSQFGFDTELVNKDIASLYCEILNKYKQNNFIQQLPEIIILGKQSAGKSTIIEFIIGVFHFLKKKEGLGSKHVTQFRLVHDNPDTIKIYKLGKYNQATDYFSVYDHLKIQKRYQELDDGETEQERKLMKNKISDETIIVEIGGSQIPLVLSDVPGLRFDGEHKNITEKLFKQQISKENAIFLYAIESNTDFQTDYGFAQHFLNNKDLQQRTIILPTKIDYEDQCIRNVTKYFKEKNTKYKNFLDIICMKPSFYKCEGMDNEEKNKYMNERRNEYLQMNQMSKQQANEEFFQQEIDYMRKKQHIFGQYFETNVGRKNSLQILQKHLFSALFKQIPQIIKGLTQQNNNIDNWLYKNQNSIQQLQTVSEMDLNQKKYYIKDQQVKRLKAIFNNLMEQSQLKISQIILKLQSQFKYITQILFIIQDYEVIIALKKFYNIQLDFGDFNQVIIKRYQKYQDLYEDIVYDKIDKLQENINELIKLSLDQYVQENSYSQNIIDILEEKINTKIQNLTQELKNHIKTAFQAYNMPVDFQNRKKDITLYNINSMTISKFSFKNNMYNFNLQIKTELTIRSPYSVDHQEKIDIIPLEKYIEEESTLKFNEIKNSLIEQENQFKNDFNFFKETIDDENFVYNLDYLIKNQDKYQEFVQNYNNLLFEGINGVLEKIMNIYVSDKQIKVDIFKYKPLDQNDVADSKMYQNNMVALFNFMGQHSNKLFQQFQSYIWNLYITYISDNFDKILSEIIDNDLEEIQIEQLVTVDKNLKQKLEEKQFEKNNNKELKQQLQLLKDQISKLNN